MSVSVILNVYGSRFEYWIYTTKLAQKTQKMERAHLNPSEKATCPLLPRHADLFLFKPIFSDFT